MEEIMQEIIKFQSERDWKQFHTPENLAKSISIEVDVKEIVLNKMAKTAEKYPVSKSKGVSTKYNKL